MRIKDDRHAFISAGCPSKTFWVQNTEKESRNSAAAAGGGDGGGGGGVGADVGDDFIIRDEDARRTQRGQAPDRRRLRNDGDDGRHWKQLRRRISRCHCVDRRGAWQTSTLHSTVFISRRLFRVISPQSVDQRLENRDAGGWANSSTRGACRPMLVLIRSTVFLPRTLHQCHILMETVLCSWLSDPLFTKFNACHYFEKIETDNENNTRTTNLFKLFYASTGYA